MLNLHSLQEGGMKRLPASRLHVERDVVLGVVTAWVLMMEFQPTVAQRRHPDPWAMVGRSGHWGCPPRSRCSQVLTWMDIVALYDLFWKKRLFWKFFVNLIFEIKVSFHRKWGMSLWK